LDLSGVKGVKQVKEIILSLEKGAMERWRHGDPWGWAEISAKEVIYVDPGLTRPIVGLEEYKAYLKQFEGKIHYQGSEFIDPRAMIVGNVVVLTYNYRSTVTTPEMTGSNQILWNTTEVYFRLAGQWKIVHTHWSYVKHKLPKTVEVPLPVELSHQRYEGVLGEIMVLESTAMERWRKGDPWGFIEIYAPEITYFDTGTPQRLNGLDTMRAEMAQREGKIHYDVMEFIAPRIQVQENVAVLTYRFFSTQLNPDGSISSRTPWNCSEVYVRMDGKWRIIHNHWSFIKGEKM
jgi:ketosteroid isomerase-like protein